MVVQETSQYDLDIPHSHTSSSQNLNEQRKNTYKEAAKYLTITFGRIEAAVTLGVFLHTRIERGRGTGVQIPPENSQSYGVSQQYWSEPHGKSQSYQASIQCQASI